MNIVPYALAVRLKAAGYPQDEFGEHGQLAWQQKGTRQILALWYTSPELAPRLAEALGYVAAPDVVSVLAWLENVKGVKFGRFKQQWAAHTPNGTKWHADPIALIEAVLDAMEAS